MTHGILVCAIIVPVSDLPAEDDILNNIDENVGKLVADTEPLDGLVENKPID